MGYAACHWCHVTAYESFENPDVARLMNERFVKIKVDRQERPDVDDMYPTPAGTPPWRSRATGATRGVPVLRQMLDRPYVEQAVKRDVRQDEDQDPVADVMISGLRAAATLKDDELEPSVATLSQQDRSMRVRQAAIEALKVMGEWSPAGTNNG